MSHAIINAAHKAWLSSLVSRLQCANFKQLKPTSQYMTDTKPSMDTKFDLQSLIFSIQFAVLDDFSCN